MINYYFKSCARPNLGKFINCICCDEDNWLVNFFLAYMHESFIYNIVYFNATHNTKQKITFIDKIQNKVRFLQLVCIIPLRFLFLQPL